jgi:signal transduction histidine kinase
MFRPHRLRDRILTWYGGTVLAVLAIVLLLVHMRVRRETDHQLANQMANARRVVKSLQQERTATLAMVASLAGREPKLGAVMGHADSVTGYADSLTIEDVLRNDLQKAFGVDFIRVTNTKGLVRADTSGRAPVHADFSHDTAVIQALHGGNPGGTLVLPDRIYLVATAPINAGSQDLGTVTLGRVLNDETAEQLCRNTGSQVTFFAGRQLAATSWPSPARSSLLSALRDAVRGPAAADGSRSFLMTVDGQRMMSLLIPILSEDGGRGQLLIQSNLDAALRPYNNIQQALAVIGLLGFLAAVLGSMIVAGGITQPLHRIAHAAQGLMQGDWTQRAPVVSRDEVGLLAETFNRMAERLESWDSDMRAAVTERTRELDAAVAQLDAAFQLMRQFNADASHELRTPLTVIRGEAEVALRVARSGPEYEEVLRTIQDETEHMSRIIEQLLLLARADSGELRLERRRIALDDVLREVIHRAEVLARARHIRLVTESLEPMLLDGDEDQLRRLALNLVDNAIKYTPEGGEVRVRLGSRIIDNAAPRREAMLEIEDTGIGIEAADLPRVFDRFYRVDKSRSRSQGGSGLGLAICRWIVEGHGGQIEVQSRPGLGTTFTVRLPMDENAAASSAGAEWAEAGPQVSGVSG